MGQAKARAARPPIDRGAEEAQTITRVFGGPEDATEAEREAVRRAAAQLAEVAEDDVALDAVENATSRRFVPSKGIGSLDLFEIILMYLLDMTNTEAQVSKGTLRQLQLRPARYEQLSDSAQRFMAEVHEQQAAEAAGAAEATGGQ